MAKGTGSKSSGGSGGNKYNIKVNDIPRLNYGSAGKPVGGTAGTSKSATNGQRSNSYTRQNIADKKSNAAHGQQQQQAQQGRESAIRKSQQYQQEQQAKQETNYLQEAQSGRAVAERKAQNDDHRRNAQRYTDEANRLEQEKQEKSNIYVDGIYVGMDKQTSDSYDKRIAEQKQKAEEERGRIVNTSDKARDDVLKSYLQAVENEQGIAGLGTDPLSQQAADAARQAREAAEEALIKENQRLGNETYFGLADEAQARDLFEGWAGERAAGSAASIGTALQWFDQASDDMARYEYDLEHGEGAYDRAIAGKNVNQIGDVGETLFNASQGWQQQAEQDWATGTADMTDTEKQIAGMGKTAADMTLDMIENMIIPGSGRAAMALRVGGQGSLTQDARENNDIDTRAAKMAFDGAMAFLSEYLIGGAEAVYGKSVLGKGLAKKFGEPSPLLKTVLNTEGFEEGLEYALGYLGDKILGFDQNGEFSKDELKQEMLIGYIMGVLFNGVAGGINYDAAKIRNVVDEAIEATQQGITPQEAAEQAKLQPNEEVKIDPSKQVAEEPEAEPVAVPTPAAQPEQDSTGTAWTGDWGSWVDAALSGGALSDTDIDTIYSRPAARQAFEEITGVSLEGMTEEEAKATIGMAAGTTTQLGTAAEPNSEAETGASTEQKYPKDAERRFNDARNAGPDALNELFESDTNDADWFKRMYEDATGQPLSDDPDIRRQQLSDFANSAANETASETNPVQEGTDTAQGEASAETQQNAENSQQNQQNTGNQQERNPNIHRRVNGPNENTDVEYNALLEASGVIEPGENPARDIPVPKKDTKGQKVGEGIRTVAEAEATPESRLQDIKAAVVGGNFGHVPVTNDTRSNNAITKLAKDGWTKSVSDFLAAVDSGKVNADVVAMGAHLLNEAGNSPECTGRQYVELAMAYNEAVHGTAQALAAGRILKTLTPEGKLYGMEKAVENINKGIRKNNEKRSEKRQKAEVKLNEELVEEYLKAETDEQRDAIQNEIVKDAAAQVPNTFRDKFTALRYLNMLGNFKTQVRNVLGNVGMTTAQKAKNEVRSLLEGAYSKVIDKEYERQYKGLYGIERLAAANEDFVSDEDLKDLAMGEKKWSDIAKKSESEIMDAKKPFSDKNPLGKVLNAYSLATDKAMEFGDLVFVRANYADALAGYMNAHGITAADWKAMVNDPSKAAEVDKARNFAIKQAQEATFRDTNGVSKFASNFDSRWSEHGKAGQIAQKVSQGVVPFRRTPANVLVRMEEYSPLGIANTIVKAIQAKNGTAEVSEVIDSAAKTMTGTGLAILGYVLASMRIARTKDDDKNEEALAKLRGQQDYSVEVGGKSFTMDWLSPASAPFFMGAELYNLVKEGGLTWADGMAAITSFTNPMLEMSMLSGVNDALNNLSDFEGDNSAVLQFFLNSAWSYLTQGISNTMLGQIEQFSEDYRQTYYTDSDNPLLRPSEQKKLAKLMNKTPLPKYGDYQAADYIDAWGRKQENDQNLLVRAGNVFFNPGYVSDLDKKATAVDDVIADLYQFGKTQTERDNFPNVVPRTPSRSTTVNGTKLTPEEYETYAINKGQKSLEYIDKFTKTDAYKNMDEYAKAQTIEDIYSYAEYLAAKRIAKNRGEELNEDKYSQYAGISELRDPIGYLGIKAGFNEGTKGEQWDSVDALVKASQKMSPSDREYLRKHVDNFGIMYDLGKEGVGSAKVDWYNDEIGKVKEKTGKDNVDAYGIFQTVVSGYNSGKLTEKDADAFMNRTKSDGSYYIAKARHTVYEGARAAGADPAEALAYWDILDKDGNGRLTKKEYNSGIKKIPKEHRSQVSKSAKSAIG